MQKAGGHPCRLPHLVGRWLQVLFHSPNRGAFHLSLAVLVHYRLPGVFSLIRWSGQIHTVFHVHRATWDTRNLPRLSHTRLSRSMAAPFPERSANPNGVSDEVPQPRWDKSHRFGLFRVRSPLLTESRRFLFLGLLRCFSLHPVLRRRTMNSSEDTGSRRWVAHSEISGSTPACGYPELIAACYVLHRLLAPRHSPSALSSLITNSTKPSNT